MMPADFSSGAMKRIFLGILNGGSVFLNRNEIFAGTMN